jgi:plastocyanin
MVRAWFLASAVLTLCVAASCPAAETSGTTQVLISQFMFMPMTLTIKAGSSVTWVNRDDEPHTVVSDTGLFRSGALDTDMSYTFKFDQPGSYRVLCSIHPQMTAVIVVE